MRFHSGFNCQSIITDLACNSAPVTNGSFTVQQGTTSIDGAPLSGRIEKGPFSRSPTPSPDPDDACFSAGIHEDIIIQLSQISDLRVILSRPGFLTTSRLKPEPSWNPIRDTIEFQQLIAKFERGG